MKKEKRKRFEVKLHYENNYYRIHITHPDFKGRIRKRFGNRTPEEAEEIVMKIRFELGNHFEHKEVAMAEVDGIVDQFISLNVKKDASIFDYKDEFIASKKKAYNKKTRNLLSPSTITSYQSAIAYLENYFIKNRIPQHPSQINEETLNGFYNYASGCHNYKVKLHNKAKGFIKFLAVTKNLPIDQRYKLSAFQEEYDNQCPEDNDIALSETDVKKLVKLRRELLSGEFKLKRGALSEKIPANLQMQNQDKLETNLVKSLDCFLFMISTGMYWSDVMKSELFFSENGNTHVRYRRAKNGSLCKAIPLQDDGIFIGKEIAEQYKIKNKSNFPLNLSLNHFDKHLKRISILAGINHNITNKMARKTFASILYFNRHLPIHFVQILLGHKNVKDTAHYLRISDNDIANDISDWITQHSHIKV